jgi:hypothetical protein
MRTVARQQRRKPLFLLAAALLKASRLSTNSTEAACAFRRAHAACQ